MAVERRWPMPNGLAMFGDEKSIAIVLPAPSSPRPHVSVTAADSTPRARPAGSSFTFTYGPVATTAEKTGSSAIAGCRASTSAAAIFGGA